MTPFTPVAATVQLACSTTPSAVNINNPTALGVGRSVRVYNSGTEIGWLNFGNGTVTAAANTAIPIPPGSVELFAIGSTDTHAAAVTAQNTTTLHITVGDGI